MKKRKGVVEVSVKEDYVNKVNAKDSELDSVAQGLVDGMHFVRVDANESWGRLRGRKRRIKLEDLDAIDRFKEMCKKGTMRGKVCGILSGCGEISRQEYTKYNEWGDVRWMREFTDEEIREGDTWYVLKKEFKG